MFLIFPSLKFRNGHITDAIVSDDSMRHFYDNLKKDPIAMCKLLRKENSKSLVVWDLDSYEGNDNSKNLNNILEMANSIDIPIQLVSYIKDTSEIKRLLKSGISRVFIDELIIKYPSEIIDLIREFSTSKICAFALNKNNFLYQHPNMYNLTLENFVSSAKEIGISRLLYGNYNVLINKLNWIPKELIELNNKYKMRITLIEGIRNSTLLRNMNSLTQFGIDSAMLGDALFENLFPCQKIWRLVESHLEV